MSGFGVHQMWCGTSMFNDSSSDPASPLPHRLPSADAPTATARLLSCCCCCCLAASAAGTFLRFQLAHAWMPMHSCPALPAAAGRRCGL